MIKTGKYMFLMPILFSFHLLWAKTTLTVEPSSTEVGVNEEFILSFQVESDEDGQEIGKPQFDAPYFDEVGISRSQSFQMQIMGGSQSQRSVQKKQTFNVHLQPQKKGQFVIRNLFIEVNGKKIEAPDIAIDVKDTGGAAQPGRQQRRRGWGLSNPPKGVDASNAVVLRTEPNKLKAYVGEMILLDYSLYTKVQIQDLQVERYPTISGVIKEEIDMPLLKKNLDFENAQLSGQNYKKARLAQYAIFPLQSGELKLDVFKAKVSYAATSSGNMRDEEDPFSLFNQFFNSMRLQQYAKISNPVVIEVEPLPAQGKPGNFSGLVGQFQVIAIAEQAKGKVGEALQVKVKLEGQGHVGRLEKLPIQWPDAFELYEDKAKTQFLKDGSSERIYEFMIVPKAPGAFQVPPIEITFFNPKTKNYEAVRSAPLDFEIEGSAPLAGQAAKRNSSIPESRRTNQKESPNYDFQKLSFLALSVLGIIILVFLGFWMWKKTQERKKLPSVLRQKQKQRLEAEMQSLQRESSGSPQVRLAGFENFIYEFLEWKLSFSVRFMTREQLAQKLSEGSFFPDSQRKLILEILQWCDFQRYAQGAIQQGELNQKIQLWIQEIGIS